ncbi:hypothetical protein CBR_g4084 [Chara braunii]|uniref:GIY-YIG domain-containing protein n=1 Tax=Chara braunii TaxID=69332 RepID=A0A388KH74_CHABU|nr:hypothetical protein CBR_g4084 [Chara braunii]|eukprot:GBG69391.1 hypothetical protein CBR_g4084 [Chara braunii]
MGSRDDLSRAMQRRGEEVNRGERGLRSGEEDYIFRLFLYLVIKGEFPWARKWVGILSSGDLEVSTNDPGVYVLVSPYCRHFYLGCTSQKIIIRWADHVKGVIQSKMGNAPRLHCWLKVFGWEKYLALPLISKVSDPFAVERALIRRFSPTLNTQGNKSERKKTRRRKGKRERGKRGSNQVGGTVITFNGKASIIDAIRELKQRGGDPRIHSSGGTIWVDKWKIVKGKVGGCVLEIKGCSSSLGDCRKALEEGGVFRLKVIKIVTSRIQRRKNVLRDLLRFPGRIRRMYQAGSEELIALFRTTTLFFNKKTRNYLKNAITKIVRRKFGVEIRRKPCVKIPFSPGIRIGEVSSVAACMLSQTLPDKNISAFVGKRVRVVFKKRITVGGVIHNHRLFAEMGEAECTCQGLDLPRVGGHVKVRLENVGRLPAFVTNSKNITKGYDATVGMLEECIREGLEPWSMRKIIRVNHEMLRRCIGPASVEVSLAMTVREVKETMVMFQKLAAVPIDRNPGATLLICPSMYVEACKQVFNLNPSYESVFREEVEILRSMKEDYEKRGLRRVARWQTGGKVGQSYILPKAKDLDRWRPISPCTHDPGRLAGSRVGKAIRYMLFGVDRRIHFDLKSTDEMKEYCGLMQKRLGRKADGALIRSYDIKDMFARLSHHIVLDALAWLIKYHQDRGMMGVKVSARGKICAMIRKVKKEEGFVVLKFEDIREVIEFEVTHTFIRCAGGLLKQVFGIPMGRNSSPAIACLVCAFGEVNFVMSLGRMREMVCGMWMIDDVAVAVAFKVGDQKSISEAENVLNRFGECYDNRLTLVRKDVGGNSFDF